jgi:DNA-binding NarL/FixJ family response regulator
MAALCEAERARASASDRAQQWLDAAQLLDQASRPYPAAYARWRASELLLLAAPPHQVAGPARRAHDVALTLPMPALAARLAALATRAHITLTTSKTSGAPRNGPLAALTTRELDVLALVADVATNGDIARRLGIRPRTVSAHVATILRKLGVSTRYAAAATYDRSQTSRY